MLKNKSNEMKWFFIKNFFKNGNAVNSPVKFEPSELFSYTPLFPSIGSRGLVYIKGFLWQFGLAELSQVLLDTTSIKKRKSCCLGFLWWPEIRKTIYKNLWDVAVRKQRIYYYKHVEKEARSQINNLALQLMELEKINQT